MRRGIWSELVPYGTLRDRTVRRLLERYDLALHLAVTPDSLPELGATLAALGDVPVTLWPMLSRAEGRWPNAHNVGRWIELVDALAPLRPAGLAIDLEPPFDQLDALLSLRPWAFVPRGPGDRHAVAQFRRLLDRWERNGRECMVVTMPLVLDDASGGWQHLLGTPVDALGAARVSVMLYSSLLEGYSRGALRRRDVRALLGTWARRCRRRFDLPSVSLGCVGVGVLGHEPTLRDPAELADDVAIVRGAGVDDLLLYSLGGVLERHPERWLDAFTATASTATPAPTWRARAVLTACAAGGRLGGLLRSPLRHRNAGGVGYGAACSSTPTRPSSVASSSS